MDKVVDVSGHAWTAEGVLALCVDENSQIQALARSAPVPPMMPRLTRRTHDCLRHGVTSLFAASNT